MSLTLAQDSKLVQDAGPSTRYLLATVTAPPRVSGTMRPDLNVALVVDRSGSMAGRKLEEARAAASYALELLDPRDRAAVIAYDDRVQVAAPSAAITPASVERAQRAIASIMEGGNTNLSEGWLTGCREVAEHLVPGQVARCLLLTDGLANVGITSPDELERHAQALRPRGVRTSTFGIGADFDEVLLSRLAETGGGNFRLIREAAEIPRLLREELLEGLEVVAPEAELVLRLPRGVRATSLNDLPLRERDGGEVIVSLGDLISEQVLQVMLQLDFDAGPRGAELPILAWLQDGAQSLDTGSRSQVFVRADAAELKGQPRDQDVARRVGTLILSRARRRALAQNRDRDYHGAKRTIDECEATLGEYAGDDAELLALVANLGAERETFTQPMEFMTRKMAYSRASSTVRMRSSYGSAHRLSSPDVYLLGCSDASLVSAHRASTALRRAGFRSAGKIRLLPAQELDLPVHGAHEVLNSVAELRLVDGLRESLPGGVGVILTEAALADNWFSHWHAAGRAAVVSLHGVAELVNVDLAAFLAYEIVLNGLANASPYYDLLELAHEETRACLYDLCMDKRDMEVKLQAMHLCGECERKLDHLGINVAELRLANDAIRELARPVSAAASV